MKKLLNANYLYVVGAVLGMALGYAYWKYIGCSSGTCAITSKPLNSTLYFGMLGALLGGAISSPRKSKSA